MNNRVLKTLFGVGARRMRSLPQQQSHFKKSQNIRTGFWALGRLRLCLHRPFYLFAAFVTISYQIPAFAQGTLRFGFEEFQVGATPPYTSAVSGGGYPPPVVSEGPAIEPNTIIIPPHEGKNLLAVRFGAIIESPDSQPISSFSLYLYMPKEYASDTLVIRAGTALGRKEEVGSWQRITGNFDPPVKNFSVTGYLLLGQILSTSFGIDSVEITTVPEPSATLLCGSGFCVFLLLRRLSSQRRKASH
jgi:hypothetical protein